MRKVTLFIAGMCFLIAGPVYAGANKPKKKEAPKDEKAKVEPKLFHLPVSEALVSESLVLRAKIAAAWHLARTEVHYRRVGQGNYTSVDFERSSTGGYAATIPAKEVAPPGIEYYIVSKDRQGTQREHFASSSSPHRVVVRGNPESVRFANELARHRGNRSRAKVSFEYFDFGNPEERTERTTYNDYYWQLDIDYTFRILKHPYYIRLGYRRLRSESQGSLREPLANIGKDQKNPGIDWGFAELAFRFHELIGFKARLILGATREGFAMGGGAALRIGYDPGTHVAVVFEGAQDLGMITYLRLAWNTVPGFPMGASVGVTNYPGNGDYAVQLLFDVQRRLFDSVTLAVRAGYQARDYRVGGPAVGGWLIYEF